MSVIICSQSAKSVFVCLFQWMRTILEAAIKSASADPKPPNIQFIMILKKEKAANPYIWSGRVLEIGMGRWPGLSGMV